MVQAGANLKPSVYAGARLEDAPFLSWERSVGGEGCCALFFFFFSAFATRRTENTLREDLRGTRGCCGAAQRRRVNLIFASLMAIRCKNKRHRPSPSRNALSLSLSLFGQARHPCPSRPLSLSFAPLPSPSLPLVSSYLHLHTPCLPPACLRRL